MSLLCIGKPYPSPSPSLCCSALTMSSASTLLSFSLAPAPVALRGRFNGALLRLGDLNFGVPRSYFYNHGCPILKRDAAGRVMCQVKLEDDVDDETCELVSGLELVIGEGQDSIRAYLLKAVKNNNGTGVLLLSDIFGFEDSSTRDFAYRVACNGYNVLLPDLFRGDPWSQSRLHTEFEPWLTSQLASRVAKDIDTSVKWLANEFTAAGISEKLGIIGFCFGGGKLIETLARDQHSKFGTGVCFYGTRIDTSLARDIKVPVLFICGDKDHLCPLGILEEVEKKVEGSRVVIYSGRGHGFAHRPESQEEDDDAENAFAIMRSWLQDCLVSVKNRIV
ncbi:carboxymethylenebutenolidase homolog isoform X2 [Asparagus officinalis]|uniref:carboxymethylenebutenolidase homolog isoform X2 n=1 Tax=Asparagus officinalis TaxID=4686 RepID=UPI00098E5857|nr:carboxymethylenebutenolidase homolog isoform X2 [Asparagus officinalis]